MKYLNCNGIGVIKVMKTRWSTPTAESACVVVLGVEFCPQFLLWFDGWIHLQVYRGEVCLNTVQISALLALDTRRALDRAAKSVKALDEQCCAVMAVFGDIQHSAGNQIITPLMHHSFVEWHLLWIYWCGDGTSNNIPSRYIEACAQSRITILNSELNRMNLTLIHIVYIHLMSYVLTLYVIMVH